MGRRVKQSNLGQSPVIVLLDTCPPGDQAGTHSQWSRQFGKPGAEEVVPPPLSRGPQTGVREQQRH